MVEVEWREFENLRFHEAGAVVGYDAFDGGHLLVGTVVTQSGEEIQGLIRWDADEASSWELLNGRADKVIFSIEFSQISSIEQEGAFGSTVTLRDGRTFRLDDANDVDRDNRGILIAPEVAMTSWRVVPWEEFREIRFGTDATVGTGR
jgi:hypothetical protein